MNISQRSSGLLVASQESLLQEIQHVAGVAPDFEPLPAFASKSPSDTVEQIDPHLEDKHISYLDMYLEGASVDEIAKSKEVSDTDVMSSFKKAKKELNADTKAYAARRAIELGLIKIERKIPKSSQIITNDEYQVLNLAANGKTMLQISKNLTLKEESVKKIASSIKEKMGAEKIITAFKRAYEFGFFDESILVEEPEEPVLEPVQANVIDGVSRGEKPDEIVKLAEVDNVRQLGSVLDKIVRAVGAKTVAQAVDLAITSGTIPVKYDLFNSVMLMGSKFAVFNNILHGYDNKANAALMGLDATTFRGLRNDILIAYKAPTIPVAVRRVHELDVRDQFN